MKRLGLLFGLFIGAIAGCGSSTHAPDMATVQDMSMPDLAQKDCGQVLMCVLQSGTMSAGGLATCEQGASSAANQQAGAILLCFAQHCLNTLADGGAGGQTAILQCLAQNCSSQLMMCQGLGI